MAQPCAKPACDAEPEVEPIFRCMFVVARFAVAAGVCRQPLLRCVLCAACRYSLNGKCPILKLPRYLCRSVSAHACPRMLSAAAVAAAVAVAFPSVGAAGDMRLC